jgi:DNA-binding MarR family transcriptional regulator
MLSKTAFAGGGRLSQADYEALADFRYALRQFLRISEESAYAAGLTPQQHQGLLAIKGYPGPGPITVGELAERLQLRPHSAVMLADRLVANQLVERRMPAQPEDQRQVHLALTERGEGVIEGLAEAHREELCRLEPNLARLCADLRGQKPLP